jgi:hypothetical protein
MPKLDVCTVSNIRDAPNLRPTFAVEGLDAETGGQRDGRRYAPYAFKEQ